ncbi:forkhead box protein R2 [Hipposideros larvatus]
MDIKLKNREFWYSLHGQIPGLLDWDMGRESFLPTTTDQYPISEQYIAKYMPRTAEPPKMPLVRKPDPDGDGPDFEASPWINPPPRGLSVQESYSITRQHIPLFQTAPNG